MKDPVEDGSRDDAGERGAMMSFTKRKGQGFASLGESWPWSGAEMTCQQTEKAENMDPDAVSEGMWGELVQFSGCSCLLGK